MIFFNENISHDTITEILTKEKDRINKQLDIFNIQKQTLLMCMGKIINDIENIDSVQELTDMLTLFKDFLNKTHLIEFYFENCFKAIEDFENKNNDLESYIEEYNHTENILQQFVYSYNIDLETFIQNTLNCFDFSFNGSTNNEKNIDEPISVEPVIDNTEPEDVKIDNNTNTNINTDNSTSNNTEQDKSQSENILDLTDNPKLIISEKQNKVFLPYKIKDLEKELKSSKKYVDINELIRRKYILPLDRFKNPIVARFKETYNLMRNKENSSFIEALDLSLELSFNSTLNPAVIAACKNKDELDIYLDCLQEQELDDFKLFEIIYEINPTIK